MVSALEVTCKDLFPTLVLNTPFLSFVYFKYSSSTSAYPSQCPGSSVPQMVSTNVSFHLPNPNTCAMRRSYISEKDLDPCLHIASQRKAPLPLSKRPLSLPSPRSPRYDPILPDEQVQAINNAFILALLRLQTREDRS